MENRIRNQRYEEYKPLFYKVTVRCGEAVLKRKINGKMKVLAGYSVEVLETIRDAKGEIAEESTYENSFECVGNSGRYNYM